MIAKQDQIARLRQALLGLVSQALAIGRLVVDDGDLLALELVGDVLGRHLALLIVAVFWHARLGLQELVEDYVHNPALKFASLLKLNLLAFAGAAFGLLCLIRIALGGA